MVSSDQVERMALGEIKLEAKQEGSERRRV